MTAEWADPDDGNPGTFFDLGDGTAVVFGGNWHGWLMRRHPDGQFVSVRKLLVAERPHGSLAEEFRA